jgi:N-acetylneuraminic acid mutarotase
MNTLILHSRLNVGRIGHAAVYINNRDIYVIGGYNANTNKWLASVETCYDAFNSAPAGGDGGLVQQPPHWEMNGDMNEPRYYFGCCTWNNEFIFVFGGMNDQFMQSQLSEGQNKCLNSIERYSVECNRWDQIELKTYQKFPFLSHLVAVHLPWDKDRILIVGGQTYNKKTQKFENLGVVYKFDPIDEKLKACKELATTDRFLMGMGISDGSK